MLAPQACRAVSPHGAAARSASRSAAPRAPRLALRRALRLALRRAPLPRTPLPSPLPSPPSPQAAEPLNLINDILVLSKIEAGQLEIAWQPFNISTALEGAAQLVRMQAEARGIDLVVDIRSMPQLVLGDALRLRQVVLNLLSNAIKFTKESTIWVRCWLEDDTEEAHTVRFEVEDTGVGMLFTLFT